MNTISFKRIRQLWFMMAVIYKKRLLFSAIGLLCALFMANTSILLGLGGTISFLSASYYLLFCIFLSISLSDTFIMMQTKEGRSRFLTLPAQNAEKFIACTTWAIVVPIIIFLADTLLVELLRIPISQMPVGKHLLASTFLLPAIARDILDTSISFGCFQTNGTVSFLLFHVFTFSLYLLGSSLWCKRVFLKTVACIGGCTFIFMLSGILSRPLIKRLLMNENIEAWLQQVTPQEVLYTVTTIGAICTIVVWWFSYRLFCRKQVIPQKWNWRFFTRKQN